MKLIAIGGGGFTADTDRYLDDFTLSLARGSQTRLGFITTASNHDAQRIERFNRLMVPKVKLGLHLSPSASCSELLTWLEGIDLLYIGGGDTNLLQSIWSQRNYWPVLQSAISRGLWIAGVSAGAVVWFEAALIRNSHKSLQIISGQGLIAGSVCAHFSSEPDREVPYIKAIQADDIPSGIAIDDGVAVVFEPGKIPYYVTARAKNYARYVSKTGTSSLNKMYG